MNTITHLMTHITTTQIRKHFSNCLKSPNVNYENSPIVMLWLILTMPNVKLIKLFSNATTYSKFSYLWSLLEIFTISHFQNFVFIGKNWKLLHVEYIKIKYCFLTSYI